MTLPGARVLVVDDDVPLARAWGRVLSNAGFDVETAHSLDRAKQLVNEQVFDVVVLDLILPEGMSTSLLPHIRKLRPQPATAVISGHIEASRALELHGHCDIVIPKPVTASLLTQMVEKILPKRRQPNDCTEGFCQGHQLSPRETDVIRGAAKGLLNKEIAGRLDCKLATVTTYWQRIFKKTGCHSRNEVLSMLLSCHERPCPRCSECPREG